MTHARVIGAWRRLVAAPGLSPAIERFLGLLSQTPYPWREAPDGKIRTRLRDSEACVITGAVRYWTGIRFSVGDWLRAADVLGLSYADAGLIVEAADEVRPAEVRTRDLRQRLLAATRPGISVATSRPMPDRTERAPRLVLV